MTQIPWRLGRRDAPFPKRVDARSLCAAIYANTILLTIKIVARTEVILVNRFALALPVRNSRLARSLSRSRMRFFNSVKAFLTKLSQDCGSCSVSVSSVTGSLTPFPPGEPSCHAWIIFPGTRSSGQIGKFLGGRCLAG